MDGPEKAEIGVRRPPKPSQEENVTNGVKKKKKEKNPKSASMLLAGQRHICHQVLSIRMSCSK